MTLDQMKQYVGLTPRRSAYYRRYTEFLRATLTPGAERTEEPMRHPGLSQNEAREIRSIANTLALHGLLDGLVVEPRKRV